MKKAGTQERILDAAVEVFASHGWHGARTAEIARMAEVNEVTLFRKFGSKSKLMEAVVRRYVEGHHQALIDVPKGADVPEILESYGRAYFSSLLQSPGFVRTLTAESPSFPVELQRMIQEVVKPLRQYLVDLLLDHQRNGKLRSDVDCVIALDLFTGMLFSRAIKMRFSETSYSDDSYRRQCIDLFMRGVQK